MFLFVFYGYIVINNKKIKIGRKNGYLEPRVASEILGNTP